MNKRIGVDLDGCLYNTPGHFCKVARDWFGKVISTRDITDFDLAKCTPLKEDQIEYIFKSPEFYSGIPTQPHASNFIDSLVGGGWSVYLVTARPCLETYQATIDSLRTNRIQYHGLIHSREKDQTAKRLGLSVFVDDRPHEVGDLAKVCDRVFMPAWPYNRGWALPPNVVRVAYLAEILPALLYGCLL